MGGRIASREILPAGKILPLFPSTQWYVCRKVSAHFVLIQIFPIGLFLLHPRVRYLMGQVGARRRGCLLKKISHAVQYTCFLFSPTSLRHLFCPFVSTAASQALFLARRRDPGLTEAQHLPQDVMDVLDWPRTTKDPFEGVWEVILSCVLAHPEWSGNDLFQEVQRLFPGRYQPSQLSTLQLGLRKIRAHLLEIMHEPWPHEVIQAPLLTPSERQADQQEATLSPTPMCSSTVALSHAQTVASGEENQPVIEDEANTPHVSAIPVASEPTQPFGKEESQHPPELLIHHLAMPIADDLAPVS